MCIHYGWFLGDFLISAFLIVESLMIGRPHMWTRFIMDNEMTTMVAPPLIKGSSSSMVVAPPLLQLSIVKEWMMKQMLKGDGVLLLLLTSLICMKRSVGVLTNLVCHSNIGQTFESNTIINCWMNVIENKNKVE